MNSLQEFICSECSSSFSQHKDLVQHLKILHPFLQKFICKQNECNRTYSNLNGLRKHFSTTHNLHLSSEKLTPTNSNKITNNPRVNTEINATVHDCPNSAHYSVESGSKTDFRDNIHGSTSTILKNAVLRFVSKLYGNSALPRNIVQIVITEVRELIKTMFDSIDYLIKPLKNNNEARDILHLFFTDIETVFESFGSEYLRFKYLEKNNLIIKPERYFIGERAELNRGQNPSEANMVLVQSDCQIIPLRKTLKQFLELPNVLDTVCSYVQTEESVNANDNPIITSIFQAKLWRNLKLKFLNRLVLPLYIFFDDFDPNNPLGSKAGVYKLGAVYCSLACIPPQFASSLENIFLTQLFHSSDRTEFGNERVFSKIIEELKFLETEGITITSSETDITVYFTLFLLLGDNLGLNSILGFDESFSSNYYCRICRIHKNDAKSLPSENIYILRNVENYNDDYLNQKHGIKEICVWNSLPNFHVVRNISCDLMHDLFEGVLRYDMSHIIDYLIKQKFFSLSHLNARIKFFKFTEVDTGSCSIPVISQEHLKKKCIIMSAAEMMTLVIYFGVIIGDLVPEGDHCWQFYIVVHQIIEILLANSFSTKTLFYLKHLIEEHHNMYISLFEDNLKPKFHFLVHYPRLIQEVGPVRQFWAMRYEAFHKTFKMAAKVVTSRVNIVFTLSMKQQLKFSLKVLTRCGFSDTMEFGPKIDNVVNIRDRQIQLFLDSQDPKYQFGNYFPWIKKTSIIYKVNDVLQTDESEPEPNFGVIKYILQMHDEIIFILLQPQNMGFHHHLQAYEISFESTSFTTLKLDSNMPNALPFSYHNLGDGKICIVPIH